MGKSAFQPGRKAVSSMINVKRVLLARRAIERIHRESLIDPGHDRDVLVAEFHAMTEGFSFQAVMWPEVTTPAAIRAVTRRWLDSLAAPPPAG